MSSDRSTVAAPRGLALVTAVLALAWLGLGWLPEPSEPLDRIAWVEPAAAQEQAAERGVPILYVFSADWCAPCHRLEGEVFADPDAAERVNESFVPVLVLDESAERGSNEPEIAELLQRHGVVAFPTLVVADPQGRVLRKRRGYDRAADTVAWLLPDAPGGASLD